MADIPYIGEILIDLTQSGFHESGVPLFAANVAVAAARLLGEQMGRTL